MDLKDDVGGALEDAVGRERSEHVLGPAEMHVERGDEVGERLSGERVPRSDQAIGVPPQAHVRKPQRLLPVVATNRVRDAMMRGDRPFGRAAR